MHKVITLLIAITLLLQPLFIYAQINNAGFEGGIHKNEMDNKDTKKYKEVIFLTGEPILLEGTVEMDIDDDTLEYEYELTNSDGTVTLEREIELERIIEEDSKQRQVVEVNNITDYDEEITITDGDEETIYTLVDYQFHNSTIDDKQPVIDFYKGDWLGTKTYSINENEGQVTVEITGNIYGYGQYWGATETQKIHKDINYSFDTDDSSIEWYGYADIDVSFNRTKEMEYFKNLPYQTSFRDGYTLTEQEETIMKYSYNLPVINNGEVEEQIRNQGEGVERFETLPTRKKLYIPRYQDIKGHWAEWDIKRLAGLKVVDGSVKFYGPGLHTKRIDFAKWIVKAMNLIEEEQVERSYVKPEAKPEFFKDIPREHPDYDYIRAIKEKGIMNGVGDNKFLPEGNLTRAQAITIVIRTLGLERLAPNLPFNTRFKDDQDIPLWAKKAIYVADQIGLAEGTPEGYIYPNEYMTKAEAAAFLNRFITYLQENLKKDYRENILNF
ncbi:S-layer homology domain-containing protein [Thermohalobacter berrensis]|uniref:S-layer protein n=1 Tax=Thermohalobacter berrensis TaxID=99594 RepID=A0A419T7P8_9FIRM|nr:S-layer homology domain-containing protein [Thermohalobacter berrensis]RKD33501.1 S-layer protein [Thermohalobacter berrensis]